MRNRLFALLILISWARANGQQRPLPEPPRDRQTVGVSVMVEGRRQVRRITISMPAPPVPADEDDEHPPPRPVMRLNINTAVVERENFELWLFPDEPTEGTRWRHLNDVLRAKIEATALEKKLTKSQRAKLRIAGRGDIKRFFDQVEERRTAFETERQGFRTGLADLPGRPLRRWLALRQDAP